MVEGDYRTTATMMTKRRSQFSISSGSAPTPPPLPERHDSLDKQEETELRRAPWFQAGIPRWDIDHSFYIFTHFLPSFSNEIFVFHSFNGFFWFRVRAVNNDVLQILILSFPKYYTQKLYMLPVKIVLQRTNRYFQRKIPLTTIY